MRLGLGYLAIATLAMSGCGQDTATTLADDWGCSPIVGMAAIAGDQTPNWVLVGETTESREAPAAVADIACHLARGGSPVFVGVSQYHGGDTDAETQMLADLKTMIAKGAPLTVERIGGADHPYALRTRSKAEEGWAQALTERVSAVGASHAVLLVPQADAFARPISASDDGGLASDPELVFLRGRVVSLEAVARPAAGLTSPAIRILRETADGFHGELAFNRLTRPTLAIVYPEPVVPELSLPDPDFVGDLERFISDLQADSEDRALLRQQQEDIAEELKAYPIDPPIIDPELDLPEFVVE